MHWHIISSYTRLKQPACLNTITLFNPGMHFLTVSVLIVSDMLGRSLSIVIDLYSLFHSFPETKSYPSWRENIRCTSDLLNTSQTLLKQLGPLAKECKTSCISSIANCFSLSQGWTKLSFTVSNIKLNELVA